MVPSLCVLLFLVAIAHRRRRMKTGEMGCRHMRTGRTDGLCGNIALSVQRLLTVHYQHNVVDQNAGLVFEPPLCHGSWLGESHSLSKPNHAAHVKWQRREPCCKLRLEEKWGITTLTTLIHFLKSWTVLWFISGNWTSMFRGSIPSQSQLLEDKQHSRAVAFTTSFWASKEHPPGCCWNKETGLYGLIHGGCSFSPTYSVLGGHVCSLVGL